MKRIGIIGAMEVEVANLKQAMKNEKIAHPERSSEFSLISPYTHSATSPAKASSPSGSVGTTVAA